ncbi:MAG: hypothetical protein JNN30_20785 [Rhodanobacteraceae bacterium]|nr:hypothetical protein [Rhodanobacteraceae bacterium]
MSGKSLALRVVQAPAFGFICLSGGVTAVTQAAQFGAIPATLAPRGVGCLMGLVLLLVGVALLRLRPLLQADGSRSKAALSNRFDATLLIPAGLGYIVLFALGPLELAQWVTPVLALATVLATTLCWTWLLRASLLPAPREGDAAPRKPPVLLYALYLYALGNLALLLWHGETGWAQRAAAWMSVVFWMLYTYGSVAFIRIERSRAAAA